MDSPVDSGGIKGTGKSPEEPNPRKLNPNHSNTSSSPSNNLSTVSSSKKTEMLKKSNQLLEKCLESGKIGLSRRKSSAGAEMDHISIRDDPKMDPRRHSLDSIGFARDLLHQPHFVLHQVNETTYED